VRRVARPSFAHVVLGAALAALVATLAVPPGAAAHEADDLAAIETHVQGRIADPSIPAKVKKAYKALDKTLHRPNPKDLTSIEVGKMQAVAAAVAGKLKDDRTLATLLEDALQKASDRLSELLDDVSVQLGGIAKTTDRDKLAQRALKTYGAWASGRGPGAIQSSFSDFKNVVTVAKGYERVLAKAAKVLKKQGGPTPSTTTPDPQKVYTYVGSGQPGFNGDGRSARRSDLYFVTESGIDPSGRLVILDWNNHMVRRLKDDGTLERLCGSGTPGDSEGDPLTTELNHPSSLAFDPAGGRIFLAAWHNHKVKVYDETGPTPRVYTIAGTTQGNAGADGTPATDAKYNLLPGILRLPNGDLLTVDAANQVLRLITLSSPFTATNVAGVSVQTGDIYRFAGQTGQAGLDGDGGDRLSAKLAFSKAQDAEPDGRMAQDSDGNIYVVNGVMNAVRKIAPDGTITRFAGTGTAGYAGDSGQAVDAQLNRPADVAVAPDKTVFISDADNHVIRKVAPDGTITTYAGLGQTSGPAVDGVSPTDARFNWPSGLELDANGNLFVADRSNNVIRVITSANPGALKVPVAPYVLPLPSRGGPPAKGPAGTIDTYAGTGGRGFNGDHKALDTLLYWPQDCVVDESTGAGAGEVYFPDWNNHRVRKVATDGTVTTVVGSGELGDTTGPALQIRMNHPTDLQFNPIDGALWIAAWHTDKILRLDPSDQTISYMAGGARGFAGDGLAIDSNTKLNIPSSVKFDHAGNWYISDEGNRRLRSVISNVINTIVGTGVDDPLNDDGPGALANLAFPVGQSAQPAGRIALSPDDHYLYVADTNHHRIRRVDLTSGDNHITTIAGTGTAGYAGDGGPALAAQFSSPVDVETDPAGNIYVADRDNNAIRKIDIDTLTISTIAGDGTQGYLGDGGAATKARLSQPGGLCLVRSGPQAGRIYVADTYNSVVRVIWE